MQNRFYSLIRYSFSALLLGTIVISCKHKDEFPALSNQLSDSIYVWEQSKLKYAQEYDSYLRATSKDVSIHTEKSLQFENYPWKVTLNKEKVDSFLAYVGKNLTVEKDHKSAFGELPNIDVDYPSLAENYVIADLLDCKLAKYNLSNSKGEKITIDDSDVSISKNMGSITFTLAKWDLQGQHISGNVTLAITAPYDIYHLELQPGDKSKTFDFGPTKITVLEMENNILHYQVQDHKLYATNVMLDSCMSSRNRISFPEYFYKKIRAKPNLSYQQFLADSVYFELGRKWKNDPKRINIVYFQSCDPGRINIYGYQHAEIIQKEITLPIDAKIQ